MKEIYILLLAFLLDFIYPFHRGLLLKIHPVYTSFKLAFKLFKPYATKIYGVVVWFIIILLHLFLFYILYNIFKLNKILEIIFLSIILKFSFSAKLLIDTLNNAYKSFVYGNSDKAKFYVQQLVRRNVYRLDDKHTISAAIESAAESLVDGYVSPLFYFSILGPFGALFQRLTNTLDSAFGYKYEKIRDIGFFSATMDTVINYIPARLSAMYITLSAFLLKLDWRSSIKVIMSERKKIESINARYPISSISGALRVMLEKPNHYKIGANFRPPCYEDIIRARNIVIVSMIIHIIFVLIVLYFLKFLKDYLW